MSMGLRADKRVNNVTRFVTLDTNNIGVTGMFIAAILVEHKKKLQSSYKLFLFAL